MSEGKFAKEDWPDPTIIVEQAVAYRLSIVLFTAQRLGVFDALAGKGRTAGEVASECGAATRPLKALLSACVAQGLLKRSGATYTNSSQAQAYLTSASRAYIGDGLRYAEDLYEPWGRLQQLLRTDSPVVEAESYLGGDKERTRNFVMGMHNRALGIASVFPKGVDLQGRKNLLDVGGGPGTYSILLAIANPGLRATVLDLAGVLEISREIIADAGLSDRINTMPGDYLAGPFPNGFDVVLLSGMMHRESTATCRALLGKAFEALNSDGIVVVSDVFFDNVEHDTPLFATPFALNMMLTSRDGSAHSVPEMSAWIEQAGFRQPAVKRLPPPNPHSIVMGIKP